MFKDRMISIISNNIVDKMGTLVNDNGQWTWHTPKLLNGLNYESKGEDDIRRKIGAHFLTCNTLGVEGHVGAPGWD